MCACVVGEQCCSTYRRGALYFKKKYLWYFFYQVCFHIYKLYIFTMLIIIIVIILVMMVAVVVWYGSYGIKLAVVR